MRSIIYHEEREDCVKYTDALYPYYEDRKERPDAAKEDVIYENEETIRDLKKYL